MRSRIGVAFLFAIIGLAGCGGGGSSHSPSPTPTPMPSPSPTPTPTGSASVDHIFVVVLENHSLSQVIGNSAMPYFNSLASQHALAANYFANTHPSIGNYFMLTTGKIVTNDNLFAGTVSDDNIVRALTGAGKTWKGYFESLPSPGFIDQDAFPYDRKHNPFAFLSDVRDSSAQAANVVPLTQLASDVSSGSLPNYAFVIPNELHNAHDCPDGGTSCSESDKLAAADNWMKANLDPLIHSSAFANGVLIITWDESDLTDLANGGGQIATVLVGANVKTGFRSTTLYQHESVLRLALDLLKVSDHPGASNGAPTMTEFFQ